MEVSQMLYIVIVLFVFATMMGLLMFSRQMQKEPISKEYMYAHTGLAVASLTLLVIYCVQHPTNYPKVSVILFGLAALLGIYMFTNFLKKKDNPFVVDLFYGLFALAGFVTLVMFVFG